MHRALGNPLVLLEEQPTSYKLHCVYCRSHGMAATWYFVEVFVSEHRHLGRRQLLLWPVAIKVRLP